MKTKTLGALLGSLGSAVLTWGCAAELTDAPGDDGAGSTGESVGEVASELLGTVTYAADCNAGHRQFLDKVVRYGRVAAMSPAFKACVAARVRGTNPSGNYMQCTGDPFFGAARDEQLVKVLAKTRSPNPLTIECTTGSCGGNACAGIGSYDQSSEQFAFAGWLNAVYQATPPTGDPNWPVWQAAGFTWHEVMHQYGYGHGGGAPEDCGYTSSSGFDFQSNTMPYLIQDCLGATISQSGQTCGADMATACGSNALEIVTAIGATTCECIRDPKATETVSGFAWSQNYTGSFTADPSFSYNSKNGTNGVTWLATGSYRVDFPNLGTSSAARGNVQVTAQGSSANYCNVDSWSSSGSTLQAFVKCYTSSGSATNSKFNVSYVRHQGMPFGVQGAYVRADNPTAASYTPTLDYQWSSTGARTTVQRLGTGNYSVFFPELTFSDGNVQVTAFNTSKRCKVQSWFPEGTGQRVNVRCFGSSGAAEDRKFSLILNRHAAPGTPAFAYAWADQPTAASYTPAIGYQYGYVKGGMDPRYFPPESPITIQRAGTGLYDVVLPDLFDDVPSKRIYTVTAYGSGSAHCKVTSNSQSARSARISCWNSSGAAVDSQFSVAHLSNLFIIP